MLVSWESENKLFREKFHRATLGNSWGRTEREYVTESTEFQGRVHLNVKSKSRVIQEGIEGNMVCRSGSIEGQFC